MDRYACTPYVSPEEKRKDIIEAVLAHVGSFLNLQLAIALVKNISTRTKNPLAFIGVISVSDKSGARMQIVDSEDRLEALLQKIPELKTIERLPKYLQGTAGFKGIRVCNIIIHQKKGYVLPQQIHLHKAMAEATLDLRFKQYVPAIARLAQHLDKRPSQ